MKTTVKRLLLCSVIALVVMFQCYASGEQEAGAKEITVRYATIHGIEEPTGFGGSAVKPAADQFMQDNPQIKIVLDVIPHGNFQDKVNMELAADKGPDIWDAEIGWTLDYFNRGTLSAAPDYFVSRLNEDGLKPPIRTLEFEGKIWGAPPYTDCLALFYNTDMFDEAGAEPPKNWNEFKATSIKLTKRDDNGKLTQSGFTQWNAYEHIFWSFFYQNGGTFVNEDPIQMITSEEAIGAADFGFRQPYREWEVAALDFYEGWEGFGAGKVAMSINGNWYLGFLDNATETNYDVALLPKNKKAASTQGGWNILCNKNAPDEAWKFLEYFTFDKEVNRNKLKAGYLPAVNSAYDDVDWSTLNPHLEIFYELLPNAQAMPFFKGFQEFKRTLNSSIETLITSDKSTEEVMNGVGDHMKRVLGR